MTEKIKEKIGNNRNRIMKKLLTFISIICIISVLFCGCGKKNDKGDSKSANASGTSSQTSDTDSQVSMTQGVDEVEVDDMEGNTVIEDFETGSIIFVPSNKNNSSLSTDASEIVNIPNSSSSSSTGSSSNASGSASSSSSEVSSAESSGDESRDTMSGYKPFH